MSMCISIFLIFWLTVGATTASGNHIHVLWYTYAQENSRYLNTILDVATKAHTYPQGSGLTWNLTLWFAGDPMPNLHGFDVLVIHSGEGFGTLPEGQDGPPAPVDFSGILGNKTGIEAARGERTLISGTDLDVHTMQGDAAPGGDPWDGARGYLINAVNWAASGAGLGIVSQVAAEFPGSYWWLEEQSFLKAELDGYVHFLWQEFRQRDDYPIIAPGTEGYPIHFGITNLGLQGWFWSVHAGFELDIPGYRALTLTTEDFDGVDPPDQPQYAQNLVTAAFADAATDGPPVITLPIPLPSGLPLLVLGLPGLLACWFLVDARRRNGIAQFRAAAQRG